MQDVHERVHRYRGKLKRGEIAEADPIKLTATDSEWHRTNFYNPVSNGPIGLAGGGAHFANIYVKEVIPPK